MVEVKTISRPYARAAFAVARSEGTVSSWAEQLTMLEAVVADSKVESLLDSPRITAQKKAESLAALFGDSLDTKQRNFLVVLAENKRLNLLPAIQTHFLELKNQLEKTVDVEITTAFALTETVRKALVAALTRKLEREVALTTEVDSSLLGGAFIRAGDTVIDGSVKGRLNKLAEVVNS